MQHKAVCSLFLKFNLHVSGGNHTQHHEYTKLTTASGTGHIFCAATSLPPKMQHKAIYSLFREFNLHVSGSNHTHYHEYTKL